MSKSILKMHNIEKRFGPITALSHANFELKKGSVVALVGANGAGKSTLMNVLGGITTQDNGQILINDEKVDFNSPGDAARYGIQFVHQELSIFKTMTVAENIFINKFPSKYGLISKHMMETTATQLLAELGSNLNPKHSVETLSTGDCQMVVIARAMLGSPKILILDEPTSSLSKYEKEKLNDVIRRLKTSGVAIIYISHFISEIFEVCDAVTVMRNGATISSQTINETDNATIIELMLGDVASIEKKRKQEKNETIFLSVDNLQNENKVQEATFILNKGEILGIWGLLGSGRTELVRSIIGLDGRPEGTIRINKNGKLSPISVEYLSQVTAYVSEDRRGEGVLLPMSVQKNTALPNLRKVSRSLGIINLEKVRNLAKRVIDSLSVKVSSSDQAVSTLSGGNQQKIVFGKWLETEPDLLILDEPTRGLDISAKGEILKLATNLANAGVSILFISSELEELMKISDRYLIVSERHVVAELPGNSTQDNLISALSKTSQGSAA
jgi:ABC-type sugar transport system ATPase subunit